MPAVTSVASWRVIIATSPTLTRRKSARDDRAFRAFARCAFVSSCALVRRTPSRLSTRAQRPWRCPRRGRRGPACRSATRMPRYSKTAMAYAAPAAGGTDAATGSASTSSCVAARTSSTVVSPASTLRAPSSRRRVHPLLPRRALDRLRVGVPQDERADGVVHRAGARRCRGGRMKPVFVHWSHPFAL